MKVSFRLAAVAAACAAAASAGEQSKILPPCAKGQTRIQVPADRVWPANPGEGDVCLWSMDRFAACAIAIDGDYRGEHEWWLKALAELDIKATWFAVTDPIDANGRKTGTTEGCWKEWQALADAGHSIQSHTTDNSEEKELSADALARMYGDSLKTINRNIRNNLACTIAYPNGAARTDEIWKYAIAGRGNSSHANPAGSIDYRCVSCGGATKAYLQMVAFGETKEEPEWIQKKTDWKRGLLVPCFQFVHTGTGNDVREISAKKTKDILRYIASLKDDRLWVCRFDDVVKYGQERDTAKLETKLVNPERIVFKLTDGMDDALFDFPLTVKLRLPDGWKSVRALRQDGTPVKAEFIEHDGAPYALVHEVPDRGVVYVAR